MNETLDILEQIEQSDSFAQIKNAGILPEPDADDGYYFVSYSHKDYKKVFKDIIAFQQNGLPIWYDRGLESGKSWINEVKKKISSYYCRGVIFYISENYLASESCMIELAHWLDLSTKSALFVTLDGQICDGSDTSRLDAKVEEYAPDSAAMLPVMLLVNEEIAYEADIAQKIEHTKSFFAPELFEYTFMHGTQNPLLQTYSLFMGRSAFVSGVIDKNVREVTLPATIRHDGKTYRVNGIESNAFSHCTQLEQVTVPDGWMFIMENAFTYCPSLKLVKLGKPAKLFGQRFGMIQKCFLNCPQAELQVSNKSVSYNGTFKNNTTLTHADFGGKMHVSGDCFSGCTSLKSAKLYQKDAMSDKMFYNCTALQEVSVAKNNRSYWLSQTFYNCKNLRSVTLPRKLRKVGKQSFFGCESLTEITIPKKVSSIEADAFDGCTALTTVILNCKRFSTLHKIPKPFHKLIYLDDIFGAATRIYVKHPPKHKPMFRFDNFVKVKSDKRGYTLYQRRESK